MDQDNRERPCDSAPLHEEIAVLAAGSLVAGGRFEEAEAFLFRTDGSPQSCAAMDLLARISVQKGDLRKAEQLWLKVLERDASNEAALMALRRIRSSWIVYAVVRRLGILVATALIGCLTVIGGVALYQGLHCSRLPPDADVGARLAAPAAVSSSTAEHEADLHVGEPLLPQSTAIERPSVAQEPSPCRPPPMLTISGCTVTTNATETRIVFDDGLFAYRAEFNESGRGRLESVARFLQEHTEDFWIVVEGHTDSDPMPPNSVYKDNYALGLHRAIVGVEVVRNATTISGSGVLAASAGDADPPFAEDREDAKARNRTVVIRLVPKANNVIWEGK